MTNLPWDAEELARELRHGEAISRTVTLQQFRDVYHSLTAEASDTHHAWVVIILGDEAVAQPSGHRNQTIIIRDATRTYSRIDFDFLDLTHDQIAGSVDGPIGYWSFMRSTIGPRWGSLIVAMAAVNEAMLLYGVPSSAQQAIGGALVNALAIFVSIFTLFALTLDPTRDSALLLSGRFHALVAGDRHIAVTGLSGLAFAICYVALTAGAGINEGPWHSALSALVGSGTVTTAELAFGLVIGYHFVRREQLLERQLARYLLEDIHRRSGR